MPLNRCKKISPSIKSELYYNSTIMQELSLQKKFSPNGICYGCGQANSHGFKLESFVEGDKLIAHWQPRAEHQAFKNVINGGVIGTLLDCHCNWAAAWHLMQAHQLDETPCTVTAQYTIQLKRPTPFAPLYLEAYLDKIEDLKAIIKGKLFAEDKLCATCDGLFVMVGPEHPAYHRSIPIPPQAAKF